MSIYLLVEHDNQTLNPNTGALLTAAKCLVGKIIVLVMGYNCKKVAEAAAALHGVEMIYCADDICFANFLAKPCVNWVKNMLQSATYLLAPASTYGKSLLPGIAALLDVAVISDVVQIIDADTVIHPIYAGNALATVKHLDTVKLWSIRTTAFSIDVSAQALVPIHYEQASHYMVTDTEFLHKQVINSSRPDLSRANIIVAGGRGLQSAEGFKLIEQLADLLGAAVGASRAAVDAGFIANDHQIGQTGKVVAPDLYIAIGISGAVQHLAGMRESKIIVAINKDAEAPIFQIATYGLVGDLFELVPQWIQRLGG